MAVFYCDAQVLYMFEPLHAFGWSVDQTSERSDLLRDMMMCDFSNVPAKYQAIVSTRGASLLRQAGFGYQAVSVDPSQLLMLVAHKMVTSKMHDA